MEGNRFPEQKASFSAFFGRRRYPAASNFAAIPVSRVVPADCHTQLLPDLRRSELELFRTLCPQPESVAPKLSHLLLLQILPALLEDDMHNFGKALIRFRRLGGRR